MTATILCQYETDGEPCRTVAAWDLLLQHDSDDLVNAVCSNDLPARLSAWYGYQGSWHHDNLVVVPHDPLRWVDAGDQGIFVLSVGPDQATSKLVRIDHRGRRRRS
jgi:hypothetical protein